MNLERDKNKNKQEELVTGLVLFSQEETTSE